MVFRFPALYTWFSTCQHLLRKPVDRCQEPLLFLTFIYPFAHVIIDPTINNSHIENFLKSHACNQCPYSCQAKMKFEKFKWEIYYIIKVFHATYKKFLTAIDHIDYHPMQMQNNVTRTKRCVMYDIYG